MLKSEISGWDYTFLEVIGKGGFGKVYKVEDALNKFAAVKMIENSKSARNEFKILKTLEGVKSIPQVFRLYKSDGIFGIAMEYLGVSILAKDALVNFSNLHELSKFSHWSIKTLKRIHARGVVHNDIKPQQFLVDKNKRFSLVDFGLSKKFKIGNRHKPMKQLDYKLGNFLFASLNCHNSLSLSRRDDLCSLGYMLVYLYKKTLPWENFGNCENPSEKWKKTLDTNLNISIKELCSGMPEEFAKLLDYAYGLGFRAKPDYYKLLRMFKSLSQKVATFMPNERYKLKLGPDLDHFNSRYLSRSAIFSTQ